MESPMAIDAQGASSPADAPAEKIAAPTAAALGVLLPESALSRGADTPQLPGPERAPPAAPPAFSQEELDNGLEWPEDEQPGTGAVKTEPKG